MEGAVVEKGGMVGSGSTVAAGQTVKAGQLWSGSPAAFVRDLTPEERTMIASGPAEMLELARAHAFECGRTHEELELDREEREFAERLASDHWHDPGYHRDETRSGRIYDQKSLDSVQQRVN
jgi:hypothetical protein